MSYLFNMIGPITPDAQFPLPVKIALIIVIILIAMGVAVGYQNDPIDEKKHQQPVNNGHPSVYDELVSHYEPYYKEVNQHVLKTTFVNKLRAEFVNDDRLNHSLYQIVVARGVNDGNVTRYVYHISYTNDIKRLQRKIDATKKEIRG